MIWIIGGTKDSRDILEKVLEIKKDDIIISTATEYGGKLLEECIKNNRDRKIRVLSERLEKNKMINLIRENNINLVIDASHPYAQNISKEAIDVAGRTGIKYIRFERKMLDYGKENVKKFNDLKEMSDYLRQYKGKNILSTMGSNNLAEIKEMGDENNLYIRILPTTDSIKRAEELGYLPSRIIAVQGPVDKLLNKAILESYKIDYLITKESGATGGEPEKIEACHETGTTVLILQRPLIDYGTVYNDIDKLIENIKNRLS